MRNAIAALLVATLVFPLLGAEPAKSEWKDLFNGKNLDGWKDSGYGAAGAARVEDGKIVINFGERLSGITYTDGEKLPKVNYEVELEARRIEGNDFFVGLTFPVDKSHATLILGGWGGAVCGISNLDDEDASENRTRKVIKFTKGHWYKVKLRVEANRIQTWLDDKPIIDVGTTNKKIDVRAEVQASKPFGLATFATTGEIKTVRVREISGEKKKEK